MLQLLLFDEDKKPRINRFPTNVLVDNEKASMNAFKKALKDTSVNGCYFHFVQCLVRRLHEKLIVSSKGILALSVFSFLTLTFFIGPVSDH